MPEPARAHDPAGGPSYGTYRYLRVEVDDGVASVTIDRPDRDNAFDAADHRELSTIVGDLALDESVRSILLTAAGPVFSAGGLPDYIRSLIDDPVERERAQDEVRREVHALVDLDKPLVVAVAGPANGAALAMAMLADVIVVERQVRFREPHVLLGLAAGDHAVLAWPASMGLVKAKRYLLTGDSLTAEEAERLGLVTEVVEEGEAAARARTYAARLAAGPAPAIRYTKRALNDRLRAHLSSFDQSLAAEFVTLTSGLPAEALRRIEAREPGLMPGDRRPEEVGS